MVIEFVQSITSTSAFGLGITLTFLVKYHGLLISGTSGKMKNPARATGREMTPSMMNNLNKN